MGRKEEYKLQNERYLEALRAENDTGNCLAEFYIGYWKKGVAAILPV